MTIEQDLARIRHQEERLHFRHFDTEVAWEIGGYLRHRAIELEAPMAFFLFFGDHLVLHGGCFPLMLAGTGCVGTITASGLPQRKDHALVVEAIAAQLKISLKDVAFEDDRTS